MTKKELKKEIVKSIRMIYENYYVLNHFQIEILYDTLIDCFKYLGGKK